MKHGIDFHPELQGDDSPVKLAGTVKEFNLESSDPEDLTYPEEYRVPRPILRSFSPHVLYAWCALKQAIEDIESVKPRVYVTLAGTYILGSRLAGLTNYRGFHTVEGALDLMLAKAPK